MKISFVEIAHFRKLLSVRIDFSPTTTLLVGANNSGKTSAMIALRQFLLQRGCFCVNDFTLCHWKTINEIGQSWASAKPEDEPKDEAEKWLSLCPTLDLWLDVNEGEFHHVSDLLPVLDWQGGSLGIRLRYEPKSFSDFREDFLKAIAEVNALHEVLPAKAGVKPPKLWPENMLSFLQRKLQKHFEIKAYLLDPTKVTDAVSGIASRALHALAGDLLRHCVDIFIQCLGVLLWIVREVSWVFSWKTIWCVLES
ncbi:MAG: AAA family ATPase [Janthinobacterium lividum]